MAKNNSNKLRNWIAIVLGLIMLAGLFASGVLAWGDLDDLEIEGCNPAKKNTLGVALMQKDIETIQGDLSEIKKDQSAAFKEILKRLPK